MLRPWIAPLLALLLAIGCRADADRKELPPAAALPRTLFADFDRATAPVRVRWEAMVRSLRADSGTARADSAFAQFRSELEHDMRAVNQVAYDHRLEALFHFTWTNKSLQAAYLKEHGIRDSAAAEALVDSIHTFLKARSINTQDSEGGPSFSVADDALARSVGRFLSPAAREYLALRVVEQSHVAFDDGYLKIPWNDYGDRLAMMDHIASTYPASQFAAQVREDLRDDLRYYLAGLDGPSEPLRELPPDAKANIKYFLAKYGSTAAAVVVRGYSDALAAKGYREGRTLDEFFAAQAKP
jgi:hypothetical protein